MTDEESGIAQGAVLGMIIHGKVRNLIVVDSVSNGVVKGHALMGQHALYFAEAPGGGVSAPRPPRTDGNLFSGRWIEGDEVVRSPRLPEDMAAEIREIDAAMSGQSVIAHRALVAEHHRPIFTAMETIETLRHERPSGSVFRP